MDLIEAPTAVVDRTGIDPLSAITEPGSRDIAADAPPDDIAPQIPHLEPRVPPSRISEFLADDSLLDQLLEGYLDGHLKLHNLAHAHCLTLTELFAILESPQVTRILDDLTRHAELQAQRLAKLARPQAIAKTIQIIEEDPCQHRLLHPTQEIRARESVRKAAALVERISKPAKLKRSVSSDVASGGEASAPATPDRSAPSTLAVPVPEATDEQRSSLQLDASSDAHPEAPPLEPARSARVALAHIYTAAP